MLSQSAAKSTAMDLFHPWRRERDRLDRIDKWHRWTQDDIKLPRKATPELRELANLSKTPWLMLVVTAAAQSMYVDGYRSPVLAEPAGQMHGPWRTWQANKFDQRQVAVHRAALTYGYTFVTVLPGQGSDGPASVMRGVSPRKMYAVYGDPAEDDWPMFVIRVEPSSDGSAYLVRLYDEEAVYYLQVDRSGFEVEFIEWRRHNAGVCPVVRYANMLDLDGRTPGEVEPFIPAAARINKTAYDRMLAQHFSSWKVRTVAGLAEPDSEEAAARKKLELRQDDILVAEDPDTKFGSLDETPLEGFISSWRSDIEALAAVTQTPTHALTGQLVNLPLALATFVPLPGGGRTTMGEVQVGDEVIDPTGLPVRVTALSPIYHGRPCYRLRFDDGNEIVADADHLWTTTHFADPGQPYSHTRHDTCPECGYAPRGKTNPAQGVAVHRARAHGVRAGKRKSGGFRETSTVTTAEIADSLHTSMGTSNHFIPVAAPVDGPGQDLPIEPYVLGVWLGDGDHIHGSITSHKDDADELAENLRRCGEQVKVWPYPASDEAHRDTRYVVITKDHARCPYGHERLSGSCRECGRIRDSYRCNGEWREWPPRSNISFAARLDAAGVRRNKHIPEAYFGGSLKQRLALLQGIMDTDGTVNRGQGSAVITLHNERLARDVHRLVQSLGHKVALRESEWRSKALGLSGTCWRMSWSAIDPVFRLQRKRVLQRTDFNDGGDGNSSSPFRRYIVACDQVESVPVRCLTVASDTHLFCVTDGLIATHNSAEALAAARASLTQKVHERQKSFGASHAQALRLAAALEGDEAYAADVTGRVTWQDMEIRSMSQAVDALGKAAQMLQVPVEALWARIPGVEKSDVDEWARMAEEADPMARMTAELERQAALE